MGHPCLFVVITFVFSNTDDNFYKKINVHRVYSAGIQTYKPSEYESPPRTTKPGLQKSAV